MSGQSMIVIGGGVVGAAIAYGAAREGLNVRVLDQGDSAFRASRGNFGLVWVSSKGGGLPRYAAWTRDGLKLWPDLQRELLDVAGVDAGLRQNGGFWLGFSEKELEARHALLDRINRSVDGTVPFKMMGASELRQYLPGIGPAVAGGSFSELDGAANPLMLLRGLHAALKQKGADIVSGVDVNEVRFDEANGIFEAFASDGQRWRAERLVLAAGLGNARLAPQVGLCAPVKPIRGQVLVTERLKPFLRFPMNKLRQTDEGSVLMGSTTEDVGFDAGTTVDRIEWLARRAVATFPALAKARMVRAWAALRPLAPDAYPIYQESETCPGAFVATSHSGIGLAAAHCFIIGPWAAGLIQTPPDFAHFRGERFLNNPRGLPTSEWDKSFNHGR